LELRTPSVRYHTRARSTREVAQSGQTTHQKRQSRLVVLSAKDQFAHVWPYWLQPRAKKGPVTGGNVTGNFERARLGISSTRR